MLFVIYYLLFSRASPFQTYSNGWCGFLKDKNYKIGKHCLARQVSALVWSNWYLSPLFFCFSIIILVCSMQGRTGGALSAVETLQRVAAFCRWLLSSRSALWFGLRLFICIFTLRQKHMQPKQMRRRAIVASTMQISINPSDARRRKDDGGDNGLLAGCESAAQQQLLSEGSI